MSKSKVPYEEKAEIVRGYLEERVGYTESLGRANIRAKHPGFLPRSLNQGCATVLTYLFNTARVLGSNYATQGISLAIGFYGIYGQLHYLSNLFIAISLLTVSCQRPSFISGYVISSSLRRVAPQCLMETRSAFWWDIGNPSKKESPPNRNGSMGLKSLFVQVSFVFLQPSYAALIRAVPLCLFVGSLYEWPSAVAAETFVIGDLRLGYRVTVAVNFYSILGNASKLRDLFWGKAVQLVRADLAAFLVSHSEVLLLRERDSLTT